MFITMIIDIKELHKSWTGKETPKEGTSGENTLVGLVHPEKSDNAWISNVIVRMVTKLAGVDSLT